MAPIRTGDAPPHSGSPTPSTSSSAVPRACDSCRMRKVKCLWDDGDGKPCTGCTKLSIVCTTTPHKRKPYAQRTGLRIETAKAKFGVTKAELQAGSVADLGRTIASGSGTSSLPLNLVNGEVGAELLKRFEDLPPIWLGMIPHEGLLAQYDLAGRVLDLLPPQTQVLILAIMAFTAYSSDSPALFPSLDTQKTPIPPFSSIGFDQNATGTDYRVWGLRRQEQCEKMRDYAVQLAWSKGVMATASRENVASCWLLERLMERAGTGAGKAYAASMVSHLRELSSQGPLPADLEVAFLILLDTTSSVLDNTTHSFIELDEVSLCGDAPKSPTNASKVRGWAAPETHPFDHVLYPFVHRAIKLGRECITTLTGNYARSQRLNQKALAEFLLELRDLWRNFSAFEAKANPFLESENFEGLKGNSEIGIIAVVRYTLKITWASLSIAVYDTLKDRMREVNNMPNADLHLKRQLGLSYETCLIEVRKFALRGARLAARALHLEIPSLGAGFITHAAKLPLESWALILMEAEENFVGEVDFTREERLLELKWILDALKIHGWSWTTNDTIVDEITQYLQHGSPQAADIASPPPVFAALGEQQYEIQDVPVDTNVFFAELEDQVDWAAAAMVDFAWTTEGDVRTAWTF